MNKLKFKMLILTMIFLILTQFCMPIVLNLETYAATTTDDVYDVILFWGQSNMVGSCYTRQESEVRFNPEDSTEVKNYSKLSGISEDILNKNSKKARNVVFIPQVSKTVYEYIYSTDSIKEITTPRESETPQYGENLIYDSSSQKLVTPTNDSGRSLSASKGTNIIPEFCRTYYEKTGHKVIAVLAAREGKPIRQFLPYNDEDNTVSDEEKSFKLYESIKEKYEKAITYLNRNNYRIGSKLYVAFQGESDVGATSETTNTNYYNQFMKVHNNLKKDLGIQKGALIETARAGGTYRLDAVNIIHQAQERLISQDSDIVLGSTFFYDKYVPIEADYNNCNTKITLDSNRNKISYQNALEKARTTEDYIDDDTRNNAIHLTSAALSQIGRETAQNLANSIDSTAPVLNISYSTTTPTNKSVIATITSNEKIQKVEGWILSEDKKTLTKEYSNNYEGNITVYDEAGNSSKILVSINNIDKTPPVLNISYSTTTPTNKSVTATITSNKKVQEVEGWTLSENKKTLTKEYSSNYTGNLTVYDEAGNSSKILVSINNIDKTPPVLNISYSTTTPTNKSVTATITSNKKVQEIEGWTLSENKKTLTKEYSSNYEGNITVYDEAGNNSKVQVKINNIDTVDPKLQVEYSTTKITNQNVTVTITSNKQIKKIDGWNLSEDKKILTKTFTENGRETIIVNDLAGNKSETIKINVQNIDKESPRASISYNITKLTNQNIIATINANEEIQQLEGWNLDDSKRILTKTYYENTKKEITIYDIAGNSTKLDLNIDNIDKIAPQISINYSTTKQTNKDVDVTIKSNKKIQKIEGWILSEDKKILTKTFKENSSEKITIKDDAGNTIEETININNIDKTTPNTEIKILPSQDKNNVVVKIISNEKLKPVEGWTLSEDEKILTKIYTQNKSEEVIIYDMADNSQKIKINVTEIASNKNKSEGNIDKSVSTKILPDTGKNIIIYIIGTVLIVLGIIFYKKNKKYNFIK